MCRDAHKVLTFIYSEDIYSRSSSKSTPSVAAVRHTWHRHGVVFCPLLSSGGSCESCLGQAELDKKGFTRAMLRKVKGGAIPESQEERQGCLQKRR